MKIEIRNEGKYQCAGGPNSISLFGSSGSLSSNFKQNSTNVIAFWYIEDDTIHITKTKTDKCYPLYYNILKQLWSWSDTTAQRKYKLVIDDFIKVGGSLKGLFMNLIITKQSNLMKLNIDAVTSLESIFESCIIKDGFIDLTGWNTSNVTNMNYMFCHCGGLKHIYVTRDWCTNKVVFSKDMFKGDLYLHRYHSNSLDCTYAKIDDGHGVAYLEKHWVDMGLLFYKKSIDGHSMSLIGEPYEDFTYCEDELDLNDVNQVFILGPITLSSMDCIKYNPQITFYDKERIKL